MNFFKDLMAAFSKDESGAVTVDWVVLTIAVAGIAGVGVAAINTTISAAATGLTL